MSRRPHRWMDMSTHFTLLLRKSGDKFGSPTGELACDRCHAVGLHVEHIDHEVWCPNSETYDDRPPARTPHGWIVPERPERQGHDPRLETCINAARTRALNPMDYGDHAEFSVRESLDFFEQVYQRSGTYYDRRRQHDWNDLNWRLDELDPCEVNAPEHRHAIEATD